MADSFCLSNRYRVRALVITGGPCSGKSTLIEVLKPLYNEMAVFVPEAATVLLQGGFPLPGRDLTRGSCWTKSFQSAIWTVQLEMEKMYIRAARQQGKRLMICDRGLLDGDAYFPGNHWRHHLGQENVRAIPEAVLRRYDRIIHLESLATAAPEQYEAIQGSNPYRLEELSEARSTEYATRRAWAKHPHHLILRRKNDETDNAIIMETVTKTIRELLAK